MRGRRVGVGVFGVVVWALFCGADQAGAPVRVAIVDQGTPEMGKAIDIAQAALGGEHGVVEFLERGSIAKILAEQKLSLAGAVTAEHAVQAGKILRADLLAVVESDDKRSMSGVVVFDARSGERLEDRALEGADEQTAAALAQAIRDSAAKAQSPLGRRRPICVLTVRNVDLPKSSDAYCDAIGRLTERLLLRSPEIALLERERLNELRKEQDLAGGTEAQKLIASVVLLELQVARDAGGKVQATCVLSDHAGRPIGEATHALAEMTNPQQLSDELAQRIGNALQVADSGSLQDEGARKAESQRFYREARFWWAHEDLSRPLPSLEAAVALDPTNPLLQLELASGMAMQGAHRIMGGVRYTSKQEGYWLNDRLKAEEVTEALGMIEAAMRRVRMNTTGESTAACNNIRSGTTTLALRCLEEIERQQENVSKGSLHTIVLTRPEHFESVRQIRCEQWAIERLLSGAPGMQEASSYAEASKALGSLQALLTDRNFYATATREIVLTDIKDLTTQLRDMYQRQSAKGSPALRAVVQLLEPSKLQASLCQVIPCNTMMGAALSDGDKQRMLEIYEVLGQINDPVCLAAATVGKKWAEAAIQPAPPMPRPREISRRTPRLLKAGSGGTPIVPGTLPAATAMAAPFWKRCELLMDVSSDERYRWQCLTRPIVQGNDAYAVLITRGNAEKNPPPKVLKFDLNQPGKPWADAEGMPHRDFGKSGVEDGDTSSTAEGYYVLLGEPGVPVTLLPLDGSPLVALNAERGFNFAADRAALMGRKVYAGGTKEQGMLVEYDIAARTMRTLAASKRTEVQSPFDNQAPLRVSYILADPPRERILFWAYGDKGWPIKLTGLWEYNVKSGQFTMLLPATKEVDGRTTMVDKSHFYTWVQPLNDGRLLLGSALFDLANNQLTPLTLPKIVKQNHAPVTTGIRGFTEGYTWTAWGRMPKGSDQLQQFAEFRADLGFSGVPRGYVPLDDNRMLVYGHQTLWLLSPGDQNARDLPAGAKVTKLPPPIVPPEGGELPWSKVHVVYNHIRDIEATDMYVSPRVRGNDIFVLGTGHDEPAGARSNAVGGDTREGFAQLLKFSRDGGPMKPLAKLKMESVWGERFPDDRFGTYSDPPAVVAMDDRNYYVAMYGDRSIAAFPLDGSAAKKLVIDVSGCRYLELHGRDLYFGVRDVNGTDKAALSQIDCDTGKVEPLVVATRVKGSSFASYEPRIHGLWSDAPRGRLLYLAEYSSPDSRDNGIWELNDKTREKKLVLPLLRSVEDSRYCHWHWSGRNPDGKILIGTMAGLICFDPATNLAATLMQQHPDRDPLAQEIYDPKAPLKPLPANDLLAGKLNDMGYSWPFQVQEGYLWLGNGRVSLDGRQMEKFPALRSGPWFIPVELQFLDGGRQMLVSDYYGAWLLDMKD